MPQIQLRSETPYRTPPTHLLRVRNALIPFVSALIALTFGILVYLSAHRENESAVRVAHTHDVLVPMRETIARMVDAETGERGFIITGDSAYLEPYRGAAAHVERNLATLRQLTVDNPQQQARLDTIGRLVDRSFARFAALIEQRETGFEAARLALLSGKGSKLTMDSLREVARGFESEELGLLATRTSDQARHRQAILWIVTIGTALSAALALFLNLVLSRYAAIQTAHARQLDNHIALLEVQSEEMEALNTELQVTNDELATRTAEAEEANRTKAQFLANVSHDLRTPINAIMGYAQLVELGVRGPVTEAQTKDLKRINQSSTHLLTLIDDLLDFAKIEAGKIQFRLEDLSVREVIDGIDTFVTPQGRAKNLDIVYACAPELHVHADRERLNQILINLLGNAIKFTGTGGRVSVECMANTTEASIVVVDTGIGIAADQLDAVFEPFVQGGRDAGGVARGIGLGLAISRELAQAMGGTLRATSVIGEGSSFTLLLPIGVGAT